MKESTKEHVKDAVGRPRWWLINVPLMVIVLIVAVLLWPEEKAEGASISSPAPIAQERTDPRDCYSWCIQQHAKRQVWKFTHHRIGNSRGFRFSLRLRRLMNRQARSMMLSREDRWWDYPASAIRCLAYLNHYGDCDRSSAIQRRVSQDTTKVFVVCSGVAVIGFMGNGRWWGAGKGAAGCLWTKFFTKIW